MDRQSSSQPEPSEEPLPSPPLMTGQEAISAPPPASAMDSILVPFAMSLEAIHSPAMAAPQHSIPSPPSVTATRESPPSPQTVSEAQDSFPQQAAENDSIFSYPAVESQASIPYPPPATAMPPDSPPAAETLRNFAMGNSSPSTPPYHSIGGGQGGYEAYALNLPLPDYGIVSSRGASEPVYQSPSATRYSGAARIHAVTSGDLLLFQKRCCKV